MLARNQHPYARSRLLDHDIPGLGRRLYHKESMDGAATKVDARGVLCTVGRGYVRANSGAITQ